MHRFSRVMTGPSIGFMKSEQNGYLSIDRKVSKGKPEVMRKLYDVGIYAVFQQRD
jgi:hypothetical protein